MSCPQIWPISAACVSSLTPPAMWCRKRSRSSVWKRHGPLCVFWNGHEYNGNFMPESRSVAVKVEPSACKGNVGRWRMSVRRALQRSSMRSISTGVEEATAGFGSTAKYCSSTSPSDSLSVSESVDSDVRSGSSPSGSPFVVLLATTFREIKYLCRPPGSHQSVLQNAAAPRSGDFVPGDPKTNIFMTPRLEK